MLVPVTIELPLLHVMLLWGMGWDGGHLHEFVFGYDHYGPSEPGLDQEVDDEEGVTLREALGARRTFQYVYDYGDNWVHKVKVERIVMPADPIANALCIGGENACPPEDVGGAPGYEEFFVALATPSTNTSRPGSVVPSTRARSTSTRSSGGLLRRNRCRQQRPSSDYYS
jgi:hypothetical protein